MGRILVAAAISVVAWALAIAFELPLIIPAGVTLLAALIVGALWLVDQLRERRRARALAASLSAGSRAATRPDLVAERERLRAEMAKAVEALGSRRLYRLPWLVIVGPPGAGKSTAIRESGLHFPQVDGSTGPLRGVGGTRSCDWWLTNEGVLLDTAGRWTTEEEDREEWHAFLDHLPAHRPERPLDGLIATVPFDALVDENRAEALAQTLRARIDEVQARLKLSLPVYVLLTKCDLAEGFVETFGELPREERAQVWGFTERLAERSDPRARVTERFDALVDVVERRTARRMAEERHLERRARVFAFPQQLRMVREPLAQLVATVFAENIYAETPRLRGVYLTSGTQEGRPTDRVMQAIAQAMGMPEAAPTPEPPTRKSYFLRDVFTRVLFADRGVARWTPRELSRRHRRQLLAAASIFVFAALVGGLPLVAWRANASYLSETGEVVDAARAVSRRPSPVAPAELTSLGQRARELRRFREDGPPIAMRMGLYPDDVGPAVEQLYVDTLQRAVIAPVARADAAELGAFVERARSVGPDYRPPAGALTDAYDALRTHLLLTGPPAPTEPALDEALREGLTERLVDRWGQALDADAEMRRAMEPHVRFYIEALAEERATRLPRDSTLVRTSRDLLEQIGDDEMATQAILDRVAQQPGVTDMTLGRLLGRELVSVRASSTVPAGFTRTVWEAHAERMIEDEAAALFGNPWVLGRTRNDDPAAQVASLRRHYLRRYEEAWLGFVDGVEVTEVPEAVRADQLLELNTGADPFLTQLVRGVAWNVDLVPTDAPAPTSGAAHNAEAVAQQRLERALRGQTGSDADDLVEVAANAASGTEEDTSDDPRWRLRARFAGFATLAEPDAQGDSPATVYRERLDFLRMAITSPESVPETPERRRALARETVDEIVADVPLRWRPRVRSLLSPPLAGPVP